ncbi:MAG TPA: PilN domain-containing protein [Anaeromyxobacteraceae bacterium]|nr:PilN domain-containing protein [Anaeromyxobacteraceae bacterium]
MIRINLLPVRVSKKTIAGKQQLLLFGLVVVLGLILNLLWQQSRAADLRSREAKLKRTREDIAQLEKIIGEVKNIKEQQAALKEKLDILEKLKAGRSGPVRMLDELATLTPKRLELKKMEEKAAGALQFDGSAGSIDDVSAFMSALKASRYFTAVELKKTTAATRKAFRIVDFTITATTSYAPAVAAAAVPGARPAGAPQAPGAPQPLAAPR